MIFERIALLAVLVASADAASSSLALRGSRDLTRDLRAKDDIGTRSGFEETLGECRGAICGFWGDPHMITCDGLAYDCQGEGIFTLMKNHFFNIQAHFISVGSAEMKKVLGWSNYPRATTTNDIVIDVLDDDTPTLQFSFPDLSAHDGKPPSEAGCFEYLHYEPFNMAGLGRTVESSLAACRERCEGIDGCTKFSYFVDGGCHVQDDTSELVETPSHWTRSISGPVQKCGKVLPRTLDTKSYPFARTFGKHNRRQLRSSSAVERQLSSDSDSGSGSGSDSGSEDSGGVCRKRDGMNAGVKNSDCAKCVDGYKWWPCNDNRILCEGDGCSNSPNWKGGSNSNSDDSNSGSNDSNSKSGSNSNSNDSGSESNSGSNSNSNSEDEGSTEEGNGCPFLFYVDGEMQDISSVPDGGYLYGDASSATSAKLHGDNKIALKFTTSTGSVSEAILESSGDGPGELWSCHWSFYNCLPGDQEDLFKSSTGLLGSPNGNPRDDWMTLSGTTIPIPTEGQKGKAAFEYCTDNWCVSQEDSIMTYPEGTTYEDHKCVSQEYVEFDVEDPACLIESSKIIAMCADRPTMLISACQMECCYTGCPDMDHVEEELQELITLDAVQDEIDIVYDPPRTPPALCDAETGEKQGTGSDVCPNENLVQLVEKSSDALPVGDTDIIYGLELLGAIDDNIGTSIRFKVDNIFDNDADVYVRYEKKVGEYMNTPECHAMPDTPSGCDVAADTIEVGCIEFPDTKPFALVDLYFVSNEPTSFIKQNANDEREVHKCCHPPNEYNTGNEFGVVKYTFKIQCTCPTSEDTGYAI